MHFVGFFQFSGQGVTLWHERLLGTTLALVWGVANMIPSSMSVAAASHLIIPGIKLESLVLEPAHLIGV